MTVSVYNICTVVVLTLCLPLYCWSEQVLGHLEPFLLEWGPKIFKKDPDQKKRPEH